MGDTRARPTMGGCIADNLRRNVDSFRIYQDVLAEVLRMRPLAVDASSYWAEELSHFEYMLEAPPSIIRRLREHSFHLTGLRVYDYRSSQTGHRAQFERKLNELHKLGFRKLFIPEAEDLGGFGHRIQGDLVNVDTLKFYECLIAMEMAGLLEGLRRIPHPVMIEIGGGWGGLAYQLKTHFPQSTYVIVDFPAVLLFSATYLLHLFPQAPALFVNASTEIEPMALKDYAFVFVPDHLFGEKWNTPSDIGLNTVSFQEMTTSQVRRYVRQLASTGTSRLYSLNRNRSPHNHELSSVEAILAESFACREMQVLDWSYTDLEARRGLSLIRRLRTWSRRVRDPHFALHRYRHLACQAR